MARPAPRCLLRPCLMEMSGIRELSDSTCQWFSGHSILNGKQNGSPWVQHPATNGATRCFKCCESSNYTSGKQECVADLEYSGTSEIVTDREILLGCCWNGIGLSRTFWHWNGNGIEHNISSLKWNGDWPRKFVRSEQKMTIKVSFDHKNGTGLDNENCWQFCPLWNAMDTGSTQDSVPYQLDEPGLCLEP